MANDVAFEARTPLTDVEIREVADLLRNTLHAAKRCVLRQLPKAHGEPIADGIALGARVSVNIRELPGGGMRLSLHSPKDDPTEVNGILWEGEFFTRHCASIGTAEVAEEPFDLCDFTWQGEFFMRDVFAPIDTAPAAQDHSN